MNNVKCIVLEAAYAALFKVDSSRLFGMTKSAI